MDKSTRYSEKPMVAAGQMDRAVGLYRIIEDHVQVGISCSFMKIDVVRAKARIRVADAGEVDWGFLNNYYLIAYRTLMDMFHNNREWIISEAIDPSEKVDFYFDEQSEKRVILATWDEYISERDEVVRALYGNAPIFRHDHEFLPLQASDFMAWWIREWTADDTINDKLENLKFGEWEVGRKKYPHFHISITEDELVAFIVRTIKNQHPDAPIVDLKHFVLDRSS